MGIPRGNQEEQEKLRNKNMQRSSRLPQISSVISFNYIGVHGRRQLLAIHVGEYQSTPRKSFFHHERSFIIRGPLASIIFNSMGHFLQHEIPLVELAWAYLLVKCVLYPSLIQMPMAHGCQTLTFNKDKLVVACLSPF